MGQTKETQSQTLCRVRGLRTFNPTWEVSIISLPLGLRELCGIGVRKLEEPEGWEALKRRSFVNGAQFTNFICQVHMFICTHIWTHMDWVSKHRTYTGLHQTWKRSQNMWKLEEWRTVEKQGLINRAGPADVRTHIEWRWPMLINKHTIRARWWGCSIIITPKS